MIQTATNIQATFNQLKNETYLSIARADGTVLQASVAHGPLVGSPQFAMFVFKPEADEPEYQEAILSTSETRLVRDFLNGPEVAALLDQE